MYWDTNIPKALAKPSLVKTLIISGFRQCEAWTWSDTVRQHVYLELSLDLTRLSLGQDLNVTRDLTENKTKERKRKSVWLQRDGESLQWEPTLMLLWYSRTLLRARTWMWLDTYRVHSQHELTHFRHFDKHPKSTASKVCHSILAFWVIKKTLMYLECNEFKVKYQRKSGKSEKSVSS